MRIILMIYYIIILIKLLIMKIFQLEDFKSSFLLYLWCKLDIIMI